ncbi:DUF4167 domain-containing protein [Labrys sp. KNU-23]|uniref:DUF4167 domain-containing protein n=1 Tax=Labrys sp. KNU-23 TaxID=2789216 RepID=UPI0011F0594C|nr:DUF4167 domain-containing protein [Labrys sp. KNU-23]
MKTSKQQINPQSSTEPRRPLPKTAGKGTNKLQTAHGQYERYLTLAQAQAMAGDAIAAENYYQHAEHYLRLMHDRAH